jgi:hypothetical protein
MSTNAERDKAMLHWKTIEVGRMWSKCEEQREVIKQLNDRIIELQEKLDGKENG